MATATIAVMAGDGIGPEVTAPCLEVIARAAEAHGASLDFQSLPAGAAHYAKSGEALPAGSMAAARAADAILLAAMGLPDIRYPDGTEIGPQLDLRFELDLYAGVRPVSMIAPQFSPLRAAGSQPIDFVLVRESTEGMFASRRHGLSEIKDDQTARETLEITRPVTEKLFDFSFTLAQDRAERRRRLGQPERTPQVACVDKANVFRAFAFMRQIAQERAAAFPEVRFDVAYVDAVALKMVQNPAQYDVLVTENMFGDILSDLGAGLMGGLGLAPSADIGAHHAVFQPCHGSAPDIAGQGAANPTAMILSGAMMLEWLGAKLNHSGLRTAGEAIDAAVREAYADATLHPREFGGPHGLKEIAGRINGALDARLTGGQT